MIDDKKIEEAARDYIDKNGYLNKYDEDPCVDIEFAYKDGAKWAINEFLKDLWHPNTEEPDKSKSDIITLGFMMMLTYSLKNLLFGIRNFGDIRLAETIL